MKPILLIDGMERIALVHALTALDRDPQFLVAGKSESESVVILNDVVPPPDLAALKEITRAHFQSAEPVWNHPYPPPRRRKRKS